jgi:hypothetical protein
MLPHVVCRGRSESKLDRREFCRGRSQSMLDRRGSRSASGLGRAAFCNCKLRRAAAAARCKGARYCWARYVTWRGEYSVPSWVNVTMDGDGDTDNAVV